MSYIELHARSAFSFLRGSAQPSELASVAAHLGLPALALCDRDGLYGTPRFTSAAAENGVRPIVGCELTMRDGSILPVLIESRRGYNNLCTLLSRAHLRVAKGECSIGWEELPEFAEGLVALAGESALRGKEASLVELVRTFGHENVFVELQRHRLRGEERTIRQLVAAAEKHRLPVLATNGVDYATAEGRPVLDVFTCLRNHTHLDAAGRQLSPNSERRLKSAAEMSALFHDHPEAIANTVTLAERLTFRLADLGYQFPCYHSPDGSTQEAFLRRVSYEGAHRRYGPKLPEKIPRQLEHELTLIGKLGFAGYFLIVWDIVNFCRDQNIMVQGRGSAANSAVCFCLGITAVDAVEHELLFERFLSEGRKSWPDIDLDLPSGDRRERVIQEVWRRYGRWGAAMTANVITYRGRSAAREIGKALNFPESLINRFSALFAHGDFPHTLELQAQMAQAGLPAEHPRAPTFATLYEHIRGLPRHLGQHSGGMIICQDRLGAIVPLENASMPHRSIAQWDKDDCADLGIIKVDLLGLGMMSVLQDTVELCAQRGCPIDLAKIPKDDKATYESMCRADTIGVFQIESRAQMATLPRMKPACFYDVAVEVAIIRPGPIQGGLMHPYLARRSGEEEVSYIDDRLEPVLRRTLGVPLFQEQILQIAMVIADFSGSEAEELRRAISFHRSHERMEKVVVKLEARMQEKGVEPEKRAKIISALQSFALYGFPESHAISFALLAYSSAWLKVHRPAEFFAGLLNNQPMGFYSSDTLLKDAKRHGIRTRPVCVLASDWRCTIEDGEDPTLNTGAFRGRAGVPPAGRGFQSRPSESDRTPFPEGTSCVIRSASGKIPDAAGGTPALPRNTPLDVGCFPQPAVRLGLCVVQGLQQSHADELLRQRRSRHFTSLEDFKVRVPLPRDALRALAEIGALNALGTHRRAALWETERKPLPADDLFAPLQIREDSPLSPMTPPERLAADYRGTRMTTGPHPMALIRDQLPDVWRASDLEKARDGTTIRIAGAVICRQRPGTAKGFTFISLEDETGVANAILTPQIFEQHRLTVVHEGFLSIIGRVQHRHGVIHIKADTVEGLACRPQATVDSHDFC